MFLSPEASFTASAVINTVGIISFKKSPNTESKVMACIPIFFGIQQFAEGVVWLSLLYDQLSFLRHASTSVFILFAWVVWPFWIPYGMEGIELNKSRKKILKWFKYVGLGLSCTLGYALLFRDVQAAILDCSVIYSFNVSDDIHKTFGVFYLIGIIAPTLISKANKAWLLGAMNLLAYFGTKIFISDRILSIWYFFAAITSIIVYWIILDYNKRIQETTYSSE